MKFCAKCGAELLEGVDNCEGCGAPVEVLVPVAQAVPQTPAQPTVAAPETAVGRAMAIVSFVCGIVGAISCSGITLGVIALIFGIVSKKEGNKSSMSTAGIALGIVSLAMYVLFIVAYILFFVAYIFLIILGIGAMGMEGMAYYI